MGAHGRGGGAGRLSSMQTAPVDLPLFDEVGEVLRALVPAPLGAARYRHHRYGIKVWIGGARPEREHYEAQVIAARHVPGAAVLALEVGFHAEHPDPKDNEQALARLLRGEARWRKVLGPEAVAGQFIDDQRGWRRLSETWPDPDLSDPELPLELATRLTDYIVSLEPLRTKLAP